jgi:DNA-binding transcriptional LysR family regulator
MDFVQLEMFVATAEARGVQRAAERVYRTQPAVSMAIRKLKLRLEPLSLIAPIAAPTP